MKKNDYVIRDPNVSVTLREIRKAHGLKQSEMAERLGIPRQEYVNAENGRPPHWMAKAVRFFSTCFDLGYLPENIALPNQKLRTADKPAKYKTD